jgi:hypothetical protein
MPNLNDMIDEVLINLAGYTYQQDRATYITNDVPATLSTIASPITLQLASTDNIGKGAIEIGEELIWLDSFDRVSNTATVPPWGRGYLGTGAAAHTAGDKVTITPTFPRYVVKKAINDTIAAFGAIIFSVKTTTFVFNAAQTTYKFNNLNIHNIMTIMWQDIGPSQEWIPIRHWSWDALASTAAFGAGAQTVTIGDYVQPGRTVKVVYATDPEPFTTNTQDYSTQTGLPNSTRDVAVLGASYRLLTYLDPARAAQVSPQADETDAKRPYGASQSATKQLYALYQQRLKEETDRQQASYPIRVHYSR